MGRRRREFSTFSLSFIDCMSCGLGAVILLFMIINHASEVRATESNRGVAARLSRVESKVLEKRNAVAALTTSLEQARAETQTAAARTARMQASIAKGVGDGAGIEAGRERVAVLTQQLRSLQARVEKLRAQAAEGDAIRSHAGEGRRLYLTGLQVAGDHILILVDTSASMLAATIVNIIRRRNMDLAARRAAPKWRWALAIVDWITTQVPAGAKFQIYTFDETAAAVLDGSAGSWLKAAGGSRLTAAVQALRQTVPGGGTDLRAAFAAGRALSPRPDSIYLITDSLPTQAGKPGSGAVSQEQRLEFFRDALAVLPPGINVNVILLPMEGDPLAASLLWQLAQATGGTFLAPSRDWP